MGARNTDAVPRIDDRTGGLSYPVNNLLCNRWLYFARKHLAVFSMAGLVLKDLVAVTVPAGGLCAPSAALCMLHGPGLCPAVPASLIIRGIKSHQFLFFHKCALDIQRNIQPAWSRTA